MKNKKYLQEKLETKVKAFKHYQKIINGNKLSYFKIQKDFIFIHHYILNSNYSDNQLDIIVDLINNYRENNNFNI